MDKKTKIYIAGHKGMVGSVIWRSLTAKGYTNLIGATSQELYFRNQDIEGSNRVQNIFLLIEKSKNHKFTKQQFEKNHSNSKTK